MAFNESKPIGAKKLTPHSPDKLGRLPWPVCKKCGLVYLKNEATKQRVKRGCWQFEDE
jgi:hypothetical protein